MIPLLRTKTVKSPFDLIEESKWPEVRRDRPPTLSAAGQAAYHRRWEGELQRIADEWKHRDRGAYEHYRRLASKHKNAARRYE